METPLDAPLSNVSIALEMHAVRQARLDDRLLDLFPPEKRTLAELEAHFMVRVFIILNSKPSIVCWRGPRAPFACKSPDMNGVAYTG